MKTTLLLSLALLALANLARAQQDFSTVEVKAIHFGDTFFSGRFPNIDLGGGGDVRGYIRNVEDAIKKVPADAKLIPGHGPLSTVKELKEFHEMLVETSGLVETAIAAGKTLEQIKVLGLPEKWKGWAVPTLTTARWLEILHRGLTTK